MKKNLFIALILAALTLCACGETVDSGNDENSSAGNTAAASSVTDGGGDTDSTSEDSTDSVPLPEWNILQEDIAPETIVFISRYSNWAWGYQDNGSFVTYGGEVYSFDFGETDPGTGAVPDDFVKALEDIRDNSEPKSTVDAAAVAECYSYAPQVNAEAEFPKVNMACDAGQRSVYFVRDGEIIMISTNGDNDGELDDKAAKAMLNALGDTGVLELRRVIPQSAGGSGIKDLFDYFF